MSLQNAKEGCQVTVGIVKVDANNDIFLDFEGDGVGLRKPAEA